MKTSTCNKYIFGSIGLLLIFFIYLIFQLSTKNDILFPSFESIFKSFGNLFINDGCLDIIFTIMRLIISLFISFIISFVISFLYYIFKPSIYIFKPIMFILKVAPIVAVVLYIQVLTGGSYIAPYVVSILVVTPIMIEAYISAIDSIDKDIIASLELEKTSTIRKYFEVILPTIRNNIIMSFLQTIGLTFRILIMVEYFCYLKYGIGTRLQAFMIGIDISGIIALIILCSLLSLIVETIIYFVNKKLKNS